VVPGDCFFSKQRKSSCFTLHETVGKEQVVGVVEGIGETLVDGISVVHGVSVVHDELFFRCEFLIGCAGEDGGNCGNVVV
jgi:hypothetical protein